MSRFWIQIGAMVYKNFLVYFRVWQASLKDLAIPIITAFYIYASKSIQDRMIPLQFILPLSLIGHSRTVLYDIVMEKSEKYREYLMINGLSRSSYIISNLIFIYLKCLLITITMSSGFFFAGDLPTSIVLRVSFTYFFTALAVSNFVLFVTTFFDSKELSSDLGGFIFAVLSFMYIGALMNQTWFWYNFAFLFPQNGIAFEILYLTGTPLRVHQSDIYFHLAFDAVLYLFLYIYLDQVLPNQYGVSKHWLYIFDDCCKKRDRRHDENENRYLRDENNSGLAGDLDMSSAEFHEKMEIQPSMKRSILIKRVSKRFEEVRAVDDLSMMIFENQVFCLLGHNGAGKTTTINMLSGILEYEKGQIYIYDTLMREDMDQSRKSMGICCQQDLLFLNLTVTEHLELVGKLRGLSDYALEREIDLVLDKVKLNNESHKFARALSGGNKRKLSLGMSIIGNSKIIFLDEPTSGLDPNTRRFIWDVIKQLRQEGRTILLTTHHLDEADELADRIGIMSHGKLFALGSSSFIKKTFGEGYQLTVFPENIQNANFSSIETEIDRIISKYLSIPRKKLDTKSNEIQYLLPFDLQTRFPDLFSELENVKGIKINLQMNSLEDAFINIGLREQSYDSSGEYNAIPQNQNQNVTFTPSYNFKSQIKAMYNRKYFSVTRDTSAMMMILLPVFFVFIGIAVSVQRGSSPVVTDANNTYSFLFFINFAFCLNATVYAAFPVYERETKIRYALKAMGVRSHTYWLGTFAFDIVALTVINGFLFLFVYIFELHLLQVRPIELCIALYSYGFALITSAYLYGFWFDKSSSVYKGYAAFYFFALLILPQIIVALMKGFGASPWMLKLLKLATYHVSPMMIFQDTMVYLMIGNQAKYVDGSLYFDSFEACALFMVYLALLYITGAYYLEKKNLKVNIETQRGYEIDQNASQEVKDEYTRVSNETNNDPIRIINLKKNYGRNFTAVNNVSFGVQSGEIFGLLGPNGAGKSTTFGIITALMPRTSGQVLINKKSIDEDLSKIYINVGLCPQFDSLWEEVSVREHLAIYARIKGMKKKEIPEFIDKIIFEFKLQEHADKRVSELSGGTKRKLSVANALIGNPQILILDEPSTGLDPMAKRHLWSILSHASKVSKASIILTTHSMEEAEYLCDRIGIIVNGKFVCFGSLNYLKNTYGSGYKITISKKNDSPDVEENIHKVFNEVTKIDSTVHQETYNISYQGFLFSKAFKELERMKTDNLISDFSIYNTTLEQVFLLFSKNQVSNENVRINNSSIP